MLFETVRVKGAAVYWNYVIIGYVTVFGGLAAYSAWVVRRGRTLAQQVEPERRRFLE